MASVKWSPSSHALQQAYHKKLTETHPTQLCISDYLASHFKEHHVFARWTTTAHAEERMDPKGTQECETLQGSY